MRKFVPALLAALAFANSADAANPNWPPSPSVARQDLSQQQYWPDDPDFAGAWMQWGFTPDVVMQNPNVSDREKNAGIGLGLDAAWARSQGDSHVVIAVMDSGFIWSRTDLLNKWLLNRGELPPPNRTDCVGNDPYDCNGDGVFNLSDYTTAQAHQLPSVDLIADATLLARPDHGDVNHNGYLDPQDLIAIFSNGKDDDGNGFVDDICGWDFLWNDNDAFDDVGNGGQGYSHGAAEAQDSASEGNNGMGEIGGCPNCMVLPVRGGDSFVAQASHQAFAIYYAVSRGASVIQAAQITLNNDPLAQDALDYAWSHGTLLVASSADETSLHPMDPGNLEHPLEVNGHYYDGKSWDDPANTTFTNFSNGTNWGAHVGLSSPSSSGSDATARVSGMMGLIFSYGRQLNLNPPLSAGEAYQLAIDNAFDMDKGPESGTLRTFPDGGSGYIDFHMGVGWDAHSGYGRPDARASLDAMAAGRIPPEVDITSPLWFDLFDPATTPQLDLTGVIDGSRASSFDYQVQIAYGLEPLDADFKTVASGSGSGRLELSGSNAVHVDITNIIPSGVDQPPGVDARTYPNGGPHQFAVTLRILATAHYGGQTGDVLGQFRKTIFVHHDPDLMSGFPRKLANAGKPGAPSAGGESSPKLVDLDGDHKDEIVFGTDDGFLHAMHADGTELPGFPARVGHSELLASHSSILDSAGAADAYQEIFATPAIGDIDGDGKLEIVAATMEGELHVFRLDGSEEPGFPVTLGDATLPAEVPNDVGTMQRAGVWTVRPGQSFPDGGSVTQMQQMDEVERGFIASPVLADLDGDGKLDIIQAGMDGYLHAWDHTGAELPGFPVEVRDPTGGGSPLTTIRGRIIGTPAVGNVDGTDGGRIGILVGSNEVYGTSGTRGYLFDAQGQLFPGWPVKPTGIDVNILPFVGRGEPNSPLMGDIDGDGVPELFTHPVAFSPMAFDATGKLLLTMSNNPIANSTGTSKQGANVSVVNMGSLADLDGDGLLEYVDGTVPLVDTLTGAGGAKRHDYDHQVTAWAAGHALKIAKQHQTTGTAQMLPAFPQLTTDYQFLSNYAVADITGDGNPEIISGNGGLELTAFDKDGKQPANWPKLTGGWNMATPAVGDLDGDGLLEVVTVSRNGYLWAWKTQGRADQKLQWESFHHDLQNTGDFATPEIARAGPSTQTASPNPSGKSGCGCGAGGELDLFALLGIAAFALARKRR